MSYISRVANSSDTLKIQQGTYRDPNPVLTGLRCGNNAYAGSLTGGSTPGHESNYTMAESSGWGPPVPQLLPYNGYAMVSDFTRLGATLCLFTINVAKCPTSLSRTRSN